jgi:hypothetical protein
MRLFLLLCFLFFVSHLLWRGGGGEAHAQCCSANPVAGSVNIGILTKNTLRSIIYYRYRFSDKYFEGSKRSDFNAVKNANYNFIGSILAYGISNKVTIETELGYYLNKSEVLNTEPPYTIKGTGFYNGVSSLKYNILKNTIELTAGAGLKFPFTTKQQEKDGVQLPQTVQPSTGAFGFVGQIFFSKTWLPKRTRLFFIHRTEINGTNSVEYQFGNLYSNSVFVSKSFNNHWTGIIQFTSEIRERDMRENKTIAASGGYTFFLSPQINYTLKEKWNISLLTSIPVYRYFNGTQLGGDKSFSVNVTRDFQFGK